MKRDNDDALSTISDTDKKLLQLLVTGASSKSIAEQMGLKDGTTRVYLHTLYKRIGVNNKTSAVTWYLAAQQTLVPVVEQTCSGIETVGDRAVDKDLLSALGMMEVFLGPYGRMWDMVLQMDPEKSQDLATPLVRTRARTLWNSMVRGDFSEAADYFDIEGAAKVFIESPSDAVVLAASLLLGGFTNRATKAMACLKLKRGASIGITLDEKVALAAIADILNDSAPETALAALHRLIGRNSSRPVFRHLLIVTLFHIYKMLGHRDLARKVGNAIWSEAESARNHLQAMGDSTFPLDAVLPAAPKIPKADLTRWLANVTA